MFRRKKPPELTSDAYERWLRAGSPQPLAFFLRLAELEQEALALLGDAYTEDCAIAFGYAVQDPRAAALGASATEAEQEEALAVKAAEEHPVGLTMSGVTARRASDEAARSLAVESKKTLFGKPPDTIAKVAQ